MHQLIIAEVANDHAVAEILLDVDFVEGRAKLRTDSIGAQYLPQHRNDTRTSCLRYVNEDVAIHSINR